MRRAAGSAVATEGFEERVDDLFLALGVLVLLDLGLIDFVWNPKLDYRSTPELVAIIVVDSTGQHLGVGLISLNCTEIDNCSSFFDWNYLCLVVRASLRQVKLPLGRYRPPGRLLAASNLSRIHLSDRAWV